MRRVVVTGMGCINSIAGNIDEFADKLKKGECGIKEISLFDTAGYRTSRAAQVADDKYYEIFKGESAENLRVINFAFKACEEAMAQSGLTDIDETRFGVSIATSLGCIDGIDEYLSSENEGKHAKKDCYLDTCAKICDIFSRKYHICGPVFTTSTACAAGSNSIGIAFDAIRYGRAEAMICGGVDPISRISINGFNVLKSLSPSGIVRSFSKERDGLVIGEGAGILVLEEYEHAMARKADILCEVAGYAISNDAYHMTTPDPHGGGAIRSMTNCIKDAGITVDDVNYINAHGTGTNYNDNMELTAIKKVFGDKAEKICITSNKGMIGHMLGAAGSIEFIATILAMRHKFIPPTINFQTPIEGFETYNYATNEWIPYEISYALSNSFAFAGNCASILLKGAMDNGNQGYQCC